MKKIYKFDSGKKGFERAAYLLLAGAVSMVVAAVYFFKNFFR
ncbi:MAG: hypothetical protein QGI86_08330 [Candidatus Poribacteria bacterium]|jgi:hypothetical protein|nr:hypothetical protein [Candidatus Poribacteria bacterium]MDP6745769.1 hypothetical protein [Candidatus Poribacteria bacterium]MDP6995123.1 hypothetical protein [Candidatus Poribacteria bacterium]MDP7278495.1 hypothetical protein [Candidatus Poribacteria bacterium]